MNPLDHQLHKLSVSEVAAALPQLRPFNQAERADVLEALRGWLHGRRDVFATWQEAWNAWSGATSTSPGYITFHRSTCPDCHGRRYAITHGRPGPCLTGLNGSWRSVHTIALWQTPEPAHQAPAASSPPPLPKAGDRIRVTGVLPDDPCPVEVGAEGTVTGVNDGWDLTQITVDWDCGRTLMLLATDPFEILTD